ncbi:MAG: hypothetical protein WAL29_02585, partial [Bacteroidales bacterium]
MIKYLVYLLFIITVAFAAGGIILASRLRGKYKSDIFSSLLYYQVFIYTFGFYGIWGQVLIRAFLFPVISPDLLMRFTDFSMLLGLPFLVFAWLMLVKFSLSLSGRKVNNWFVFWFLFLNFSLLIGIGYSIASRDTFNNMILMKNYFIVMNLIYSFVSAFLIHFPGKGRYLIHEAGRRIVAPALFVIMIAQCTPLLFYSSQVLTGVIFIFAFFAGNTFLPLFFNYGLLLPAFSDEPAKDLSFDEFCRRFEVSPRES